MKFFTQFFIARPQSRYIVRAGSRLFSIAICKLTILLITFSSLLIAQWSHDPNVNNVISMAENNQWNPKIVSDGANGAIITWEDLRNGMKSDIYAQRIDASGAVQWTVDGIAISTASDELHYPNLFNPTTMIRFNIPKASFFTLRIYNLLGQEVETLVNEFKNAGRYEVKFITDGSLTSGVYLYKISAG